VKRESQKNRNYLNRSSLAPLIVFSKTITNNGKKESLRNRSGDHVDLWNGYRIINWWSWARINFRIGNYGLHSVREDISDLEDSKFI